MKVLETDKEAEDHRDQARPDGDQASLFKGERERAHWDWGNGLAVKSACYFAKD